MSSLKVWKSTGALLFDTDNITYGLVKSGYMTLQFYWTRKTLRSSQLDPNDGANWTTTVQSQNPSFGDGLWGFTVSNALSPIVFITGSGTLNGTGRSGNDITFYYSNASTSTKFYCFDLVNDNIAGRPYLKTYNSSGRITFNSLLPPLNVIASIQAPPPDPRVDQFGRYVRCYTNGSTRYRQSGPVNIGGVVYTRQTDSYLDIPITGGVEYAAFLPWSRGVMFWDFGDTDSFQFLNYSGVEGAYGRVGGISFMFGASAATTQASPFNQGWSVPISFTNLPTDRYPTALIITTANYPFPFN